MATLHIRNLDDAVHRRLRVQAARNGHSMEAEARQLLGSALRAPAKSAFDPYRLQRMVAEMFDGKPPRMSEELLAERRREVRRELAEERVQTRRRRR